MTEVTFYFDPACPWTWVTSRWLAQVAGTEGLEVAWRSLSLAHLNRDTEGSDEHASLWPTSIAAHRVVQALLERGDNDAVARFYGALGTRLHVKGQTAGVDLVREAAEEAELPDQVIRAVYDDRRDAPVAESTDRAIALAGGGVGSPIIVVDGHAFGGPVVQALPAPAEGARLWEALVLLSRAPNFLELKRGRIAPPETNS